ncbi:hypothetical protein diail_8632 [Diaporthe ilicicola]|nr:hypothetical protein diail_8632 [Diaporthe ilicicola]
MTDRKLRTPGLDKMLPTILLVFLGMLATVSLANNPHSQTPHAFENITAHTNSNQCDKSTLHIVGDGQIQVTDCFAIANAWSGTDFSIEMSDWRDSTNLPDQYYELLTHGSCEIAVKRIDCRNDTVWIGKYDIQSIIDQSVELAKTGNGDEVETTKGEMNCTSNAPTKAAIAWSLRQAGNEGGGSKTTA